MKYGILESLFMSTPISLIVIIILLIVVIVVLLKKKN